MTIICAAPDPDVGIAIRMASYLDCQARALGENGFQALAGGPIVAGLLSGLVTIFVALVGYRLILGRGVGLRDGVTGAVRIGLVLALATSWPAFQTLVYGVVVEGPGQLAAAILPAAGLPGEELETRIQQAYDTIRLGSAADTPIAPDPAAVSPPGQQAQASRSPLAQPPMPQTASTLVISTIGVGAALRLAIGFLLAVAPLAIMGLLFDATMGVFSGWVRALAGAAMASLAATIVTAIDLVMIESELARLQDYAVGGVSAVVDQQAVTTITLVFALVMLIVVLAGARFASAFRLPAIGSAFFTAQDARGAPRGAQFMGEVQESATAAGRASSTTQLTRAAAIADALGTVVRREHAQGSVAAGMAPSRHSGLIQPSSRDEPQVTAIPLGVAGRRSIGRRSLSAARRDRTA